MNTNPILAALVLPLVLGFTSASAHASGLDIRLGGKKASIGIHIGNGPHAPLPRPIGYAKREWVPGHFETVQDRVWVEGRQERVWVAPAYAWRHDACGRAIRVCVQPGYWNTVCTPGRYEMIARQVWIEGGWRVMHCD